MKYIYITIIILIIGILLLIFNTGKTFTPEEEQYISSIENERAEKDDYMKNDPSSPFNQDEKAHFEPLKYYDVNPDFIFKSKLYEYEQKDSIKVFGTKGEERQTVKFGYLKFN